VLSLSDVYGHVQRHFLAPRAKTQDAMNILMQGTAVELAERYTNMTKILFLTLWYCAIYPAAFFLCAVALSINYFADRFCLMRTWKRPPLLGVQMSQFSRRYFFSLAIVAMAIVSSYFWASFPYDNLCVAENATSMDFAGTWNVTFGNDTVSTIVLNEGELIYKYCIQDFFRMPKGVHSFPFVPKNQPEGGEWMTEEQETAANVFGWASVGVVAAVSLSFSWTIYLKIMKEFRGSYDAVGDDRGIPFSQVSVISSYVPQVHSPVFSYPLLACSISRFSADDLRRLMDWTDPDRPHAFYDLTTDADVLLRGTLNRDSKNVFSKISYWAPSKVNQRNSKSEREMSPIVVT
jgi:hypothetical protein